ncbi:hypothetical protein SOV_43670 [Sporomusa ovata DSM 2662]|uniref:Uncharacterized protein n=1 Tax=Sporomusa ovata TaxID=2378 RepID=A0A0U1KUP6_9FIRM|nr:hypothetical protein [Sporomusa ovata]EQB26755.1 hypothetical protein SOV_3c06290 [Sporomusa ovata DSM 2662]CQR70849.1 hypothetical protein SpAn4DRAFT_1827 [Sporomusa ovata]
MEDVNTGDSKRLNKNSLRQKQKDELFSKKVADVGLKNTIELSKKMRPF